MGSQYTWLDWGVFLGYFTLLATSGWYFSRASVTTSKDYFLGANRMPMWLVAISVLATSQSAATFLGGPEQGYRGDLTYLSTNIGTFIAAIFVAVFMIPKFYQHKVATVYELLEIRFGEKAKRQAACMYLAGRVLATGARLYMASVAVSMILFSDIVASHVVISIILLSAVGLAYTYMGGISSVIYSDAIQCFVYVGAAVIVIYTLLNSIPLDIPQVIEALRNPGGDIKSKLVVINFDFEFGSSGVFSFWTAITGFVLLNIAAFGMDQDMTQRVLTCKNAKEGAKAMLLSVVLLIPVVLLFMVIGLLLYIYYQRPDLMGGGASGAALVQKFSGEDITIFMHYILNEMPSGVRGLVTVGVIAAALSTLNSGLNSMSSVVIEDIYKPWLMRKNIYKSDAYILRTSRVGMAITASILAATATLCFYWQQISELSLLAFALSVMVFAYSGLLGVYFTALFTDRGNERSVTAALISGFIVTLSFQSDVLSVFNKEFVQFDLAFPWQLCIGATISFMVCLLGKPAQGYSSSVLQKAR